MSQETRLYYESDDLEADVNVIDCFPIGLLASTENNSKSGSIDGKVEAERFAVILDKTLFHPQGGAQPSDEGFIGGEPVIELRTDHENRVLHLVRSPIPLGPVRITIDKAKRWEHARFHSGGHLLADIGEMMGWVCTRAQHFPGQGMASFKKPGKGVAHQAPRPTSSLAAQSSAPGSPSSGNNHKVGLLQDSPGAGDKAKGLLHGAAPGSANTPTKNVEPLTVEKLQAAINRYIDSNAPRKITWSGNVRIVQFGEDLPAAPCGGTHVPNLGVLKGLTVTSLKTKKGGFIATYDFVDRMNAVECVS